MPARQPTGNRATRARDEAEQLVREMAHDGVQAARAGWHLVNRVGRAGLKWVEKTTEAIAKELE